MAASFAIAYIVTFLLMPTSGPMRQGPQSKRMMLSHAIGLGLYSYAKDHNGHYPPGHSSTEVFQHLVDEGYVYAPIFYFPMAGKTAASSDKLKLKPENVCWDMTDDVQPDAPDTIPIVFATGFKIDYVAGGKAHLLANGDPDGIAVFYKNNSAGFIRSQGNTVSVIDPTFASKGKTYRQLTPDGPLP